MALAMGYGRSPCHRTSRACPAHGAQYPFAPGMRSGHRGKNQLGVSVPPHGNVPAACPGQHHRRAVPARLINGFLPADELSTKRELTRALGACRCRRPAYAVWNAAQPVPQGLSDSEHARQRPHAPAWGLPLVDMHLPGTCRHAHCRKKALPPDADVASASLQDGG